MYMHIHYSNCGSLKTAAAQQYHRVTSDIRSSGNAADLYSGGTKFRSRPGYQLSQHYTVSQSTRPRLEISPT